MTKLTLQQIQEKAKTQSAANEKKFIPMEGSENEVYVYDEPADEIQDGDYTFYQFKVKQDNKEKYWRLFLNQASDLADAIKAHPNRIVHVSRGKGSKKIVIS